MKSITSFIWKVGNIAFGEGPDGLFCSDFGEGSYGLLVKGLGNI